MANDFLHDEIQEFLGKVGIEFGRGCQFAQAFDLLGFPRGIGRRQAVLGFIFSNLLREFESFGQKVNQRSIDIVDAGAQAREFGITCHGHVLGPVV